LFYPTTVPVPVFTVASRVTVIPPPLLAVATTLPVDESTLRVNVTAAAAAMAF